MHLLKEKKMYIYVKTYDRWLKKMSKVWTEVFMFSVIFTLILEGIYIKFRPNQSKTDLCKKYTLKH